MATGSAPVIPEAWKTLPVIDLTKLSADIDALFIAALLYANPNGVELSTMDSAQRVTFFTRLRDYVVKNTPPAFYATSIDNAAPWLNGFFAWVPNVTYAFPPASPYTEAWADIAARWGAQYELGPVMGFVVASDPTATLESLTGTLTLTSPSLTKASLAKLKMTRSIGALASGAAAKKNVLWFALNNGIRVFTSKTGWLGYIDGIDNYAADQAAWSMVEQFGAAIEVAPPPVYPYVPLPGSDNRVRNAMNRKIWRENIMLYGDALLSGQPFAITLQPYMPFDDPKKGSEYYASLAATVATAAVAAYAAVSVIPGGMQWMQKQFVQPFKNLFTNPLGTVKNAITDPIGAAQDYAHERLKAEVIKVTGPLGRVYDIVVDPAGFVKDKFTEEVLYPLQHPGDWIVDQGKKQIQNLVTGEVRDLLTGLLVSPAGAVPVTVTADTVPLSTIVESTPATAKKSGSVMTPLLLVLAAVELFS